MREPIRFLALEREFREVEADVASRFHDVLESQSFVFGKQTAELEAAMCTLTGAKHAVACSSGSDALYLALRAFGAGPQTAVLVPAYTFIATGEAVVNAGAVPVFTDVDATTLDVGARELEAAIEREFETGQGGCVHRATGARLVAAVVVHLFGRACRMREIDGVATRFGFRVIEDAAQAIGARGDRGAVGSWGAAGCFSFYPTKNLGGAGDGGVVTTNDSDAARRIERLRVHGAGIGPLHEELGINARMGELQAAYLNAKWPRLESWNLAREAIATAYDGALAELGARGGLRSLGVGRLPGHIHHQYAVQVEARRRQAVVDALGSAGVEARVFYPIPLHRQPCFRVYGAGSHSLPKAEGAAAEVLCLPIHPFVGQEGVDRVATVLAAALAEP
jgi:dTDP-4-amino-4,6-dideoxygalactose transaminase